MEPRPKLRRRQNVIVVPPVCYALLLCEND